MNPEVFPSAYLSELDPEKYMILLTSDRFSPRYDTIRYNAYHVFPRNRIHDFFPPDIMDYEQKAYWLRCFSEIAYSRNLEGNIAECGVFQGGFANLMNKFFPDKKCYLFDTFEGFDDRDLTVEKTIHHSSFTEQKNLLLFQKTSVPYVLSKMRHPEQIILKKGYIPETLDGVDDRFCFVHLDMDLFAPMYDALKFFYPRMVKGGAMLLHDYYNQDLPGVRKAVGDYEQLIGRQLCLVPHVSSIIIMKTE